MWLQAVESASNHIDHGVYMTGIRDSTRAIMKRKSPTCQR